MTSGEDEEILRDYVRKIYESGIKALCIEARPHPDFLGNKWWKDVDAIIIPQVYLKIPLVVPLHKGCL